MNIVAKSVAVAGSAALLAGGLALAGTTQAQAASGLCRLTIDSVTANNTQEQVDEIFLKLGDKKTKSQTYEDGQTRFGIGTVEFLSSVEVTVVENDPLFNDPIGSFVRTCTAGSSSTVVAGDGAIYTVAWTVAKLP